MQPTTHEMQDIEARHLTAVVWFAEKFQPLLFSFFFFWFWFLGKKSSRFVSFHSTLKRQLDHLR